MTAVSLGDIAQLNPRGEKVHPDEEVSFVGMAELDAVEAAARTLAARPFREVAKGYTVFRDGDLLAAKITPCWENGKIGQARLDHQVGVGSTEFHVVRPTSAIHDRYLLHFLRQPELRRQGELRMTGSAGQRRVPISYLAELQVPLPSLDEQRRIAAILDHADTLRTKRRQALAHLDTLPQAIFHKMFGAGGFPSVRAGELMPAMRNGLSPSTGGQHHATVLTLSAITQGSFDPSANKPGAFAIGPPADKRVAATDFLMCRGNGNQALVGVGTYSRVDRADLVFPDTVIAGRVNTALVQMEYLSVAWAQRDVRKQIEALARTTNGTFKVNQQSLASIELPLPPLGLQREFAHAVAKLDRRKAGQHTAATAKDELFTSLQSRAFKGEL